MQQNQKQWPFAVESAISLSFMKWRGRNFVGFVEFPSFPLTYMQKKNSVVVLRWFVFVCPSMCPCVRPCVSLSPQKSAVTFEPLDRLARNFQGPLTSSLVIFGQVTRTPGPSVSGPDPEKGGFCQIYLLRGGLGQGGRVTPFRNWDDILSFGLRPEKTGPEGGTGRGADQNFGNLIIFIKGTPLKLGAGHFWFYATF